MSGEMLTVAVLADHQDKVIGSPGVMLQVGEIEIPPLGADGVRTYTVA